MRRCRNTRASIEDLPVPIIVEILLCLPIKWIVMCKCTCKSWRHLISSAYFAKVHFAHARPCVVLLKDWFSRLYSRTLYLIEPHELNPKCCSYDGTGFGHQVNMKLDTKLKIPVIINNKYPDGSALSGGNAKSKSFLWPNTLEYKLSMVNSCNGFICLADRTNRKPMIVCNPVTDEYVELPETSDVNQLKTMVWFFGGLGFCQETNEYKVLRVSGTNNMAEIHTLGTKSWKSIGIAPFQFTSVQPTYLNGVLYWTSNQSNETSLWSFDCSNECFRDFPLPQICPMSGTLGIIADRICLFANTNHGLTDIWTMEKSGGQATWSKLMSLDCPLDYQEYNPILKWIGCSKCQAFSILHCRESNLMRYYDPEEREWKKLQFHGNKFKPQMIMHTPSFSSLKDVTGTNTKPISTCFRLKGEATPLFLKG